MSRDPYSIFGDIFGGKSGPEKLRDAMKAKAEQHDAIQAGFRKGIAQAARLTREAGQPEIADRIERLQLVRKT